MEIILIAIILALGGIFWYLSSKEDKDARHPLDSVKNISELKPMPILTEEIKTEAAPVETPPPSPVHEPVAEVIAEEPNAKPKKEKKMAAKKPEPAKKPAPAKAPAKAPKKPKK
jgi:outer membrane biosynthesis protein TonB